MNILQRIARSALPAACLAMLCVAAPAAASTAYDSCYAGLPFRTEPVKAPSIPALTVDITSYGAVGDGITLNTAPINAAIADVASRGGGHVVIPRGVWVSGPIELKSNTDLHLEKEAILLFSPDKSLYPVLPPDEGTGGPLCTPPVSAAGQSNFSVTGQGIIDGNGEAWRPVKRFKVSNAEWTKMQALGLKETQEGNSTVFYPTLGNPDGKIAKKRPRLFRFIRCSNFMIQGVVVQNSPSFHVNMILCHHFILDGIMVRCPWNAQNGDGIDLSSCHHALLTGCSVDAGDDAICMKSGTGDTGRRRGATHDIVIDRCTVFHGHGGFVIGSDNSGGMNNIMVRNCRFIDTDTGLRFKSGRDRGGLMTKIWVKDIVMCDIADEAILFDCYYQEKVGDAEGVAPAPVTPDTPIFKGIEIENVVCADAGRAIVIKGLPEMPVSDILLKNITIKARRGAVINHASGITLDHVTLDILQGEKLTTFNSNNITEK